MKDEYIKKRERERSKRSLPISTTYFVNLINWTYVALKEGPKNEAI